MLAIQPKPNRVEKNPHITQGFERLPMSLDDGQVAYVRVPYILLDINDTDGKYIRSMKLYSFASASHPVPERVQLRMKSQGRIVGASTVDYDHYSSLYRQHVAYRLFRTRTAYKAITQMVSSEYTQTFDNVA